MPRLGRLLKYLKRIRSEKFVVFVHKDKFYTQFSNTDTSIEYITYRSRYDLLYKLKQFKNIRLIHGVESRSVYPSIGLKIKDVPFVFDFQDLYTIYFDDEPTQKWIKRNLPFERACLSMASGYISYSLELIPARKKLKIKTKNVLYFPFFLDDETIIRKKPNININKIKLVYAGNVSPIKSQDSFNLTLLYDYIKDSNVFLHILPSPTIKKETLKEYIEFSKTHPNFIMEASVSQNELPKKLSEFDYGFIPFYKSENFLSDTKFKYSTTLKLFNYLEAGIPIILMNYTQYQSWIIKHYNIGISIDKNDLMTLSNKLSSLDYNKLTENVNLYQKHNLLSKHIYKVSKLYDQLINNPNSNE